MKKEYFGVDEFSLTIYRSTSLVQLIAEYFNSFCYCCFNIQSKNVEMNPMEFSSFLKAKVMHRITSLQVIELEIQTLMEMCHY